MAYGYWNRVMRVDLGSGRTWVERPDDAFYQKLLGGRGFIAHYLLSEVPRGIDPYDPENRLVFAAGVVTGAPVSGSGRHSVGAKSPMSGGYGEAEAGGHWGAELKRAGWDAIVVQGRAPRPTYLWIDGDQVELRDAGHLWGKITGEVQDAIQAELGDRLIKVAQIGPAGERLVRFANIVNDLKEFAGRTGLGAVMGSKQLKAIAVRGRNRVPVSNPAGVQRVAKWAATTLDQNHHSLHEYGTGAAMASKNLEGHLVVRNFRDGQLVDADKIDAVAIHDTVRVGMDACFACAVRCKKKVRVDAPWDVDPRYGGPEYETIGALGTDQAMTDLATLCRASQVANWNGMDTISLGATIAWATEAFELGLLTEADTGGLKLEWGNGKLLLELIERIARREGFGDVLAEGALRAARKIGRGSEQYVVQVKGLEVAMHDPRGVPNLRLNYSVTPTGGDHTRAAYLKTSIRNTVGVCMFLNYDEPTMVGLVNDVTGWQLTAHDLNEVARRGLTMARLFNLREGFTRADDELPWRLYQPLSQGPLKGLTVPPEEIERLVTDYYVEQGWDPQTGVPTPETLARLGLEQYTP